MGPGDELEVVKEFETTAGTGVAEDKPTELDELGEADEGEVFKDEGAIAVEKAMARLEEMDAVEDELNSTGTGEDWTVSGELGLHGTDIVIILPPVITSLEQPSCVTIERIEPGTTVTSPMTLLATPSRVDRIAPTMEPTRPALPGASPMMLDSLAGRSESGRLLRSGRSGIF